MWKLLLLAFSLTVGLVAPTPAFAASAAGTAAAINQSPTESVSVCTPPAVITRMVAYIRTQQQPDGSFPSIGQSSTADAVLALSASGIDPSQVRTNGHSAIDWIYSQSGTLDSTGTAAKFLLALVASHRSTVAPNGFDFAARVRNAYDPTTGLYDSNPTGNHYSAIALRAARQTVPTKALNAIAAQQQPDGGWSAYSPAQYTDTNTTAIAMTALIVNDRRGSTPRALQFLRTQQSPEGGFTFSTEFGNASDSNSTGLVTLALLAAQQNLLDWKRSGLTPVQRLIQLQNPTGAFRYSDAFPGDNAFATFQAGQAAGITRCHYH